MQLPVKCSVNPFKTSMDNGALYWEFSDGYRFAMDKSIYEKSINGRQPYKEFVSSVMSDKRHRYNTKILYKAYNLDSPSIPGVWVDFVKVSQEDINSQYYYRYAWDNRTVITIDLLELKGVEYTDSTGTLYFVGEKDGLIDGQTSETPVFNFPMKNESIITVQQYNVDYPSMIDNQNRKQDIKISVNPNYGTDFSNIMAWIGGAFVAHDYITPNDNNNIVIQKGKMFLSTKLVSYTGTTPLTPKQGSDANATYDPDPAREDKRWDFDIRLFKWRNVKVSEWESPSLPVFETYEQYKNTVKVFGVDFLTAVYFDRIIDENHLLLQNGVVVDRDSYDIDGERIIFKNIRYEVSRLIMDAYNEYVTTGVITNEALIKQIVEELLPKPEDFKLVRFSHIDPTKSIKLNRSKWCYKNHPYPYHVTLPEYNTGDLILLDGVFEKYLIVQENVIRYPFTKYIERFFDKNLLTETDVTRIWFTE